MRFVIVSIVFLCVYALTGGMTRKAQKKGFVPKRTETPKQFKAEPVLRI